VGFVRFKLQGKIKKSVSYYLFWNLIILWYCYSTRLAELEKELISRGKKGINFVIVNPAEKADFLKLDEFRNRTSVPIIQDTEALKLWDIYQGTTDDIFIFDKYE